MFTLPSKVTPKSSLKSSAGKDDGSAKSKKGRKVHFGTEGSSDVQFNFSSGKSDGKFATPFGRELPENFKCLMDCGAASISEGIQDQMVVLSVDPTIKFPELFHSGLQSVRQVLQSLSKYGVTNNEICMIANTCPEAVKEVFALVRSLPYKRSRLSELLKDELDELTKLKTST